MKQEIMSLYFIALLPNSELQERIENIKEEMATKYASFHALKLPAHVTLQPPFKLKDDREIQIHLMLEEFVKDQEQFIIELQNFGSFPPRVLFIDVANKKPISEFQESLKNLLVQCEILKEKEVDDRFHPHVTIATRDLKDKIFKIAWADLSNRNFTANWEVKSLILFKHNGKIWEMNGEFPFQGEA